MGILSNNPTGLYDVTQDWECWEWQWNGNENKALLIQREQAFMEALGEDWDYWMTQLKIIPPVIYHYEYCTREQMNNVVAALKKLCKILWKCTGNVPGCVRPMSNPCHPYECTPEYQIHIKGEFEQLFIFRTNRVNAKGRASYEIASVIPGYRERRDLNDSRFGCPHIPHEIRWDENGNTLNLWEEY